MQRRLVATLVAAFALAGCEAIYKPVNQKRVAAVTISLEDFGGFETGGFEEANKGGSVGGDNQCAVVTTPAPWSSKETYVAKVKGRRTVGPSKGYVYTNAITPGTDWVTMGWYWETDYAINIHAAEPIIFQVLDGVGGAHWRIEHYGGPDGDLKLVDANGAVMATISSPVTANKPMRVEIKWKRSGTGSLQFYIDRVLLADLTNEDLDTGTNSAAMRWECWDGSLAAPVDPASDMHIGSWYFRTDDGANIDTESTILGAYTVIGPYQDTNNGAAGDFGATLDAGTWANAGETPGNDANWAEYTVLSFGRRRGGVTTNDGARPGPKDDTRVTGTIRGGSWVWRAQKSPGSSTTQVAFMYGASSSVTVNNTSNTSTYTLGTSPVNYRKVLAAPHADVPIRPEWFQHGMRVMNNLSSPLTGDAQLLDQWAFLLHQECGPGIIHRGMVDAGD